MPHIKPDTDAEIERVKKQALEGRSNRSFFTGQFVLAACLMAYYPQIIGPVSLCSLWMFFILMLQSNLDSFRFYPSRGAKGHALNLLKQCLRPDKIITDSIKHRRLLKQVDALCDQDLNPIGWERTHQFYYLNLDDLQRMHNSLLKIENASQEKD